MSGAQPNRTTKRDESAEDDETGSSANLISFPFFEGDSLPLGSLPSVG
jgi:hypothetical protein